MPPEPIVSFEIAKWLKEHKMPQHREYYHYESDRELHDGIPASRIEKYDGATYSSVCHWFRLNGYAVVPVFDETIWNNYYCQIWKRDKDKQSLIIYDSTGDNIFGTYEEMQLVGIKKVIELWENI